MISFCLHPQRRKGHGWHLALRVLRNCPVLAWKCYFWPVYGLHVLSILKSVLLREMPSLREIHSNLNWKLLALRKQPPKALLRSEQKRLSIHEKRRCLFILEKGTFELKLGSFGLFSGFIPVILEPKEKFSRFEIFILFIPCKKVWLCKLDHEIFDVEMKNADMD